MADLSKVKVGTLTYDLKDSTARTNLATEIGKLGTAAYQDYGSTITGSTVVLPTDKAVKDYVDAETTRATGVESGLDERITVLESKGRFLSTWDATTGLPGTYPEVSGDYPKTYAYRSGDYYIVNKVAASGSTNYMPDGASITKQDASSEWVVGKTAYEGVLSLGDQFQYDGTKWIHIASATTVAFANIQGDADENANLKGKLDELRNGKLDITATVAGVGFTGTTPNVEVEDLQAALGLEDLAYSSTASGVYTPAGTITMGAYTPAGTITVGELNQTATTATLTKGDYTPAGSITGSAISGGSISVTVKDAASATEASLTYSDYTPVGAVSITLDNSGSFQVAGTNAASAVSFTGGATDTFVKSLKAGNVAAASFTEGAFTAAKIEDGFYTAGTAATWTGATYTAPSLGAATTATYAKKVQKMEIGTGADAETLIISDVATTDTDWYAAGVASQGSFSAGSVNFGSFNGGTATAIDVTKFSGGSKAADTFSAEKLPVVDGTAAAVTDIGTGEAAAQVFTGSKYAPAFAGTKEAGLKVTKAEYLKQEIDAATFQGTAATLGFTGATATNILVTGVQYDKASANGATFNGSAASLSGTFTGTAATITVEPDAE